MWRLSTVNLGLMILTLSKHFTLCKSRMKLIENRYYNKTPFSGLETHIANSYTNPLLQLLRFTPLTRNLALRHAASTCFADTCLLCEMGFLFDMLDKAEGQSCQATNFLKTFSSLPEGMFRHRNHPIANHTFSRKVGPS